MKDNHCEYWHLPLSTVRKNSSAEQETHVFTSISVKSIGRQVPTGKGRETKSDTRTRSLNRRKREELCARSLSSWKRRRHARNCPKSWLTSHFIKKRTCSVTKKRKTQDIMPSSFHFEDLSADRTDYQEELARKEAWTLHMWLLEMKR